MVTHSAETALDLNHIQYKTFSAQDVSANNNDHVLYIDNSHPAFTGLVAGAKAYIAGLSKKEVQTAIERAYQVDSDRDGIVDSLDRDPNVWNVSDRDLRIFSTLAYESETALKNAFNFGNATQIKKELADGSIKVGDTDIKNVDLDLLTQNWTLLEFASPGSGLQYSVFGNGRKYDGSYQNVVVAFRGTTSLSDLTADLKIYNGNEPTQTTYLTKLANNLTKYNASNLYATGHSLGGYLAQYFATKSVQNNDALQNSFKQSTLFNPVPLPNEKATASLRDLSDIWSIYDKTHSYVIKGEMVYDGDPELSSKISKTGFWATVGSLAAGLFTGGLGWLATAGLVGGITAANRDALKALAKGLGGYENSNIIDLNNGMDSPMDLHKMVRFYDQHGELKAAFTNGYRMDSYYLNDDTDQDGLTDYQEARIGTDIYLKDTDNDGIIDAIEVKVAANTLSAEETPWAMVGSETYFYERPLLMTAEVEQNGETTVKGIALTPELRTDGVLYTVSEVMDAMPSVLLNTDITAENNLTYITASDNDDVITVGNGKVLINSGNGHDTILFSHLNPNRIAYLNDFDPHNDTLKFAQETFEDKALFQYNQAQGQLSYNNIHFATVEKGLALDIQQFEIV